MDATLFTAYHKAAPRFASASILPIEVGRAGRRARLLDMIGDDTGENISARNPAYCELTALYWAWKNAPAGKTHIGVMHYRRLLDVTGRAEPGKMTSKPNSGKPVEALPPRLDIAPWLAEVEDWLAQSDVDLVLPRLHVMGRTMSENYARAHQSQDFEAARDVVARDHPDYLETFDAVAGQSGVRLGNMFLMRRDLFDRYCAWLFDILFKVEAKALDRGNYSPQQGRYLGFLGERLFTVWAAHLARMEPELKTREVSVLNLRETLVVPYIDDDRFADPSQINIALAADDAYLPHAAAMLRSVVDHVDRERVLNVFLLHDGISGPRLAAIQAVLSEHPMAAFHPLDTAGAFDAFYRSASRAPSNATYNRFLLFCLLPKLSRLLYLDADMIVTRDLTPLFDTELHGAALAAVTDWIMTRTLTGETRTVDPSVPDLAAYQRDVLGLTKAQRERYINAGVLLIDFTALEDPAATGDELIALARRGGYLFRDQDILNRHFAGRIHVLDGRWNVFNSALSAYDKVPADNHAKAMAARSDPWIVHYADRDYKPWRGAMVPRAELYWQALIRTPFYGEVLGQVQAEARQNAGLRAGLLGFGRATALRWPMLKRPLLRMYTLLGLSRR